VSAVMASPAAQGSAGDVLADPVRALQHALYRAAKADPGRRFHALADKVTRSDDLWRSAQSSQVKAFFMRTVARR
jgi:RNA-directed DNA polymerase